MYDKDRATIIDRRELLRIKIKSLAEEAKIIRREEHRSWGELRDAMHWHRVVKLRSEARHAHIAYGLIRGVDMLRMESRPPWHPIKPLDWDRVRKMIKSYGPRGFVEPECMRPPAF